MQGFLVHPVTGDLWGNEHGPRGGGGGRRAKLILPGRNYGWPVASHGINYDGSVFTRDAHREGMELPRFVWVPSIATSGLMVYTGERTASSTSRSTTEAIRPGSARFSGWSRSRARWPRHGRATTDTHIL